MDDVVQLSWGIEPRVAAATSASALLHAVLLALAVAYGAAARVADADAGRRGPDARLLAVLDGEIDVAHGSAPALPGGGEEASVVVVRDAPPAHATRAALRLPAPPNDHGVDVARFGMIGLVAALEIPGHDATPCAWRRAARAEPPPARAPTESSNDATWLVGVGADPTWPRLPHRPRPPVLPSRLSTIPVVVMAHPSIPRSEPAPQPPAAHAAVASPVAPPVTTAESPLARVPCE